MRHLDETVSIGEVKNYKDFRPKNGCKPPLGLSGPPSRYRLLLFFKNIDLAREMHSPNAFELL